MSTFLQWLLVWLFLSTALVLALVGVYLASEYRALVRQDVPRPATVLRKRVLGWVLSHWARRTATTDALPEASFAGREAWLGWEIRWLSGGSTLGQIEEAAGAHTTSAVLVRLTVPITLHSPSESESVVLDRVWFRPSTPTSMRRYRAGAVYGSLAPVEPEPRLEPMLQNGQLASGVLVVL